VLLLQRARNFDKLQNTVALLCGIERLCIMSFEKNTVVFKNHATTCVSLFSLRYNFLLLTIVL
jgi:hypothetical protein